MKRDAEAFRRCGHGDEKYLVCASCFFRDPEITLGKLGKFLLDKYGEIMEPYGLITIKQFNSLSRGFRINKEEAKAIRGALERLGILKYRRNAPGNRGVILEVCAEGDRAPLQIHGGRYEKKRAKTV